MKAALVVVFLIAAVASCPTTVLQDLAACTTTVDPSCVQAAIVDPTKNIVDPTKICACYTTSVRSAIKSCYEKLAQSCGTDATYATAIKGAVTAFETATSACSGAPAPAPAPAGVDCPKCARDFKTAGGCTPSGGMDESKIPTGCGSCAADATKICSDSTSSACDAEKLSGEMASCVKATCASVTDVTQVCKCGTDSVTCYEKLPSFNSCRSDANFKMSYEVAKGFKAGCTSGAEGLKAGTVGLAAMSAFFFVL